jgi:hypothetical protein
MSATYKLKSRATFDCRTEAIKLAVLIIRCFGVIAHPLRKGSDGVKVERSALYMKT